MYQSPILVCFAVKEEARPFGPDRWLREDCLPLITGMGPRNAASSIHKILPTFKPRLVITAGFAGGLDPELEASLGAKLLKVGAMPAKFHCAECVAVTASEKQVLRQLTGADVVEMESAIIREVCRENKIPSATVRVISDSASEDLPLDFNTLMTADYRINYLKLAWRLLTGPQKIPELLRFQKQTSQAANMLAEKLRQSLLP